MSWPNEKLALAAKRIGGGTPSRKEPSYWGGEIPWFTVADLDDRCDIQKLSKSREGITNQGLVNSSAKLIPAGAIVFSSRVVVGKVGIALNDVVTNQDFSSFIPSDEFDTEYLAYFLIKSKSDLRTNQRGATIKGVTTKVLDELVVPKPPKNEQRRIVARIKECMERVEEIEGLRSEAVEEAGHIFRSRCAEVFSSGYDELPVKDLILAKPSNGIFKRRNDFGEGVLLANVKDLYSDQTINPTSLERVRATAREIQKFRLAPGDVLVNRSSLKREGTGRSCVFEGHTEPVIFECHVMKISLATDKLHPHLFAAFMNSPLGLTRILDRAKTATMTTWNQDDLQSIMVPIPPFELQADLVEEFSKLRSAQKELCTQLKNADLKYIRESILRKAFAGEL